jgi:3-hydroxybutyryl-CoA dehydrogenase
MRDAAHALFARDGKAVSVIRDSGGFVTQRVVATIVNIAADICQQGICSPATWRPPSPWAWATRWARWPWATATARPMLEVLFNLQTVYGDPRYRPSPWLRRRGAIGLSLQHVEE